MPTSNEPLLLDTSAAIALVHPGHEHHLAVMSHAAGRTLGLAGHAEFETYSVLTRLPPPQRLSSAAALRLINTNFPHTKHLSAPHAASVLKAIASAQVAGGSTYDALVGLVTRHQGLELLTCDARAIQTYRALQVDFLLA